MSSKIVKWKIFNMIVRETQNDTPSVGLIKCRTVLLTQIKPPIQLEKLFVLGVITWNWAFESKEIRNRRTKYPFQPALLEQTNHQAGCQQNFQIRALWDFISSFDKGNFHICKDNKDTEKPDAERVHKDWGAWPWNSLLGVLNCN